MIAQPILTTGPKPPAQQQHQQPQNAGGFQSLLSTTDSSLMDLAQNTGEAAGMKSAGDGPPAANSNKPKNEDSTAAAYVAAPPQPGPVPPSDGKALEANGAPSNAVIPATDVSAAAAIDQSGGKGNSTAFGADALNARIVAGAPVYASQPNVAMATVPPHLLDAANTHPLPGEPLGKPGADTNSKAPTNADATLPPTPATGAAAPAAPSLPNHATMSATANNGTNSGDNSGTAAQTADGSTTANSNDPSSPSASLLAQPNQPQAAPVQADASVHTAAPYVPVGEQVALNLRQAIATDNNEIRIQLKPASLGTIDVKLNVGQDGRVNAVISADRSDTLNMLKQDAGTLQQALRDAGLNTDSSSLSFNLSGDTQSFAQSWSQRSGSNGGGNAYAGPGEAMLGRDAIIPAQRLHAGALDIEV